MTQGEVLYEIAHIETFIDICKERAKRKDEIMSTNEVDMIMPFVTKAQEATEKVSRYALNHICSEDKNEREISRLIRYRLQVLFGTFIADYNGPDKAYVNGLNNSVLSVINQINNAYSYTSALEDMSNNEETWNVVGGNDVPVVNDKEKEQLKVSLAEAQTKIKELEEEKQQLKKQPPVVNAEEEIVEKKWISCFDTFLDPRLNAEAIAEKLHEIASPHLQKNKRSFWWVVFTVFSEIHWIPNTSANQKTLLQWANLHFDCGWDWRKNNQFKFSDIQAKIKTKKSSEWNKNLTGNVIGDYYGELAQNIKDAFVEIIDGRIIDRACFILPGCQRINTGR